MPRKRRSKSSSIIPILILSAAVAIWIYDAHSQGKLRNFFNPTELPTVSSTTDTTEPSEETDSTSPQRIGRYDVYQGCTLVSDRGNDGDSFRVKLPEGRTEIIRLYFVDTPESAFKSYGGGRNNHDRIADQAYDMGGITSEQAVEIGKKAKSFVLEHLSKSPFSIYTEWDSPFNDQRYHAFIETSYNGKKRFLHEILVEKGYARIHTKGASMPDGTSERKQEDRLFDLKRSN
ncbi:MAG: thermonuclease family protein [Luteolibacter sp.]